MSKGIIEKIRALPLLFTFFCIASCLSCVSKDSNAAEETADEAPRIQQQETPPPEVEATEEDAADEPQEEAFAEPEPTVKEEPVVEDDDNEIVAVIDNVVITKQEHLQTKSEVEAVVEELNKITQQKNYNRWLTYLDSEYRQALSDRTYLAQISNSLPKALRDRRIRLNSLRDYFDYVFVPSRQNIRVDDIQYIAPARVYVIMDMSGGRRAAVYILEKGDDGKWKLVDKN